MNIDPRLTHSLDRRWVLPNLGRWTEEPWPDDLIRTIFDAKYHWPRLFLLTMESPKTYATDGEAVTFLFRPLTRSEFELLQSFEAAGIRYNNDIVIEKCVLWPAIELLNDLLAGFVEVLFGEILEASAWGSLDDLVAIQGEMRTNAGVGAESMKINTNMDIMISTVFKSMNPRNVRHLDAYSSLELISMTEKVLEEIGAKFDMAPPQDKKAEMERRRDIFRKKHGQNVRHQE